MVVINYVGESKKLSKVVLDNSHISYNNLQKLFRKKDIKINGKRINKDTIINDGDSIEIYYDDENSIKSMNYGIIYEDDNILVVDKPAGIEVVSSQNPCLLETIKKDKNTDKLFAVHRIDRNTMGLVVFAKNNDAKKELETAFKKHYIKKIYFALVSGVPPKKEDTVTCFHFVDKVKALALISDTKKVGYTKIITRYKIEKTFENYSLLRVEILTGKTHQIRAVLSHIGCPIIGDGKYGDNAINKMFKAKTQKLLASEIILEKVENSKFDYLVNKRFCSKLTILP